jgi:pellino protein
LATIPPDIAIEIDRVATIKEQDIIEWLAIPELHAREPKTRKDALKALQIWAQTDLDAIFVRRWRLTDGWLTADEAKRGLTIQPDPVASNMRSAFAAKYLPHLPYLAD